MSLPVHPSYAREAALGLSAVLRASHITQKVQKAISKSDSETKIDKSPVTGASLPPPPAH